MAVTKTTTKAHRRTGNRKQTKFWSYEKDYTRFRGEYIALDGDRILAHGKDAREVLRIARKFVTKPVLEKVLPERALL